MGFKLFTFIVVLLANTSSMATEINVAIDHAPPYSTVEGDTKPEGLILDILASINAHSKSGFTLNPVPCPFSRCVRMLARGEVDVMGGLIKTAQRQKIIEFVEPPYMTLYSSFVFYANRDSDIEVDSYQDLYAKRIAVMRGGAFYPRFDDDRQLNKVPVFSEQVAFDLLLKERVDLVIAVEDTAEVAMAVLQQPIERLRKMDYRHTQPIYGYMAMSKAFHKTELAEKIRSSMKQFASSKQLDAIVAKYQLPPVTMDNADTPAGETNP